MARTKPPLKLRRGTQAEITAAFAANPADFAEGEPVYATDTGKLYIKNAAGTLDEISGSDPGSGNGVWGQITGTLANQTDLNSALGDKVNLADLPQDPPGSGNIDIAQESTLTAFIDQFPVDGSGNLDIAQESTLIGIGDDIAQIASRVTDLENAPNGVALSGFADGTILKVDSSSGDETLTGAVAGTDYIAPNDITRLRAVFPEASLPVSAGTTTGYLKWTYGSGTGSYSFDAVTAAPPSFIDGGDANADDPGV